MTVWAVTTTHAPDELDGAARTFDDLSGVLGALSPGRDP
jgi:hypothetical protein